MTNKADRKKLLVLIIGVIAGFFWPVTAAESPYPNGDTFWFSFYSTSEADSVYALAGGATGIGPYYGTDQSGVLAWADLYNTHISYKVRPACMNGADWQDAGFVWPNDATIIADTAAAVSAVATNTSIGLWDLNPEELRYWKPAELRYLELVTATVRANDPYGRPVMMYEPNARNADGLSQTVPYQDICGKGTYISTTSAYRHNRIWARWSMEQELEAIAAANTSAVPWIVLWMAADAEEGEEHLIRDWCRHDAYMGLIMGGKGISIWSGYRNRAGFSDDFQAYFDGYLSVAADLNLNRNLAPVFLYGTDVSGVTHTVTAGPNELELIYGGATNHYPSVTYTMRELHGQQYLFMVNSATQAVTLTFNGVPDTPRTDLFQELEAPASGGSFSITLDSYEVAGFRFDGYETWRDANFTQPQIDAGLAEPEADPDGDGRTNRAEFNADTAPQDGDDFFQSELTFSNDWKTVSLSTSARRFYNIDYATNLMEGLWFPMLGNEQGTGVDLSVVDTNQHPCAFYRVQVSPL